MERDRFPVSIPAIVAILLTDIPLLLRRISTRFAISELLYSFVAIHNYILNICK
nr:MAG TPA: hypothetical protein [Caudoviricetes sp.]